MRSPPTAITTILQPTANAWPEFSPSAHSSAPFNGPKARRVTEHRINITVNGRRYERAVEARVHLADFLRHELDLTGTHVGCEHGVCGACTILLDDEPVRACLMLAVQADGAAITTVEGLAPSSTELHPLQEAFWEAHGLQCGFCTPGILITMTALLRANPSPTDQEIRAGLSGNLCRCTGYQNIVKAVRIAAER